MKKKFITMLVLLLSLGFGFTSCSDNDDNNIEIKAELTVNPETLQFSALGGTNKVIVSTKLESWTFTADPAATWCTVTKTNDTLQIEVDEFAEKTDRTAKIKVTSGDENKEITVTQKGVSAELSPEATAVTLNGFGAAVQIKITANGDNWEAVADDNSPWLRPSKEGEYLIIRATLTESERTGTILLTLNDAKATVTVEQTGATSNIGDLYIGEDGNAIGVIINKDEENNKIYIISTEEKKTPFANQDYKKMYFETDYYDGQKALAQLKGEEDWETKFAIAAYCAELEERTKVKGWYIAAAYEDGVWDALRENETTINAVLNSINATELGATQPDYPFFWTATTDSKYFNVDKYINTIMIKDKANQWGHGTYGFLYDNIARCVLRIEYLSE